MIRKKQIDVTRYDLSNHNSGRFLNTTNYSYQATTGVYAKHLKTKTETGTDILPREWRYSYAVDEPNWILNNLANESLERKSDNIHW